MRVLDELAKRVAFRCSAPSCKTVTIGPSDSRVGRVTNVGVGAHITAAAKGGPRYNENLSREQRAAYDNGVWLCGNHAKLIDDNEDRFPEKLLKAWKRNAERNARLQVAQAAVSTTRTLIINHEVTIFEGDSNRQVLEFFEDIGAVEAWGQEVYDSALMLTYELAINAFSHGRAEAVHLKTHRGCLYMNYRGSAFGPSDLEHAGGQGGAAALASFKEQCNGSMELTYRHRDGINELTLVDLNRNLNHKHPCALRLTKNTVTDDAFNSVLGCTEIHIYVDSGRIFAFSDARQLIRRLIVNLPDHCYVFHNVSKNPGLRRYIAEQLPKVRFVPS
ncbi:hypothetical protein [Streptomyces filamentosus]|uniref:hypothetical protein n=1 Tax=Streptomyces filamentosus TaxID=67294 RepID=UPI0033273354